MPVTIAVNRNCYKLDILPQHFLPQAQTDKYININNSADINNVNNGEHGNMKRF